MTGQMEKDRTTENSTLWNRSRNGFVKMAPALDEVKKEIIFFRKNRRATQFQAVPAIILGSI